MEIATAPAPTQPQPTRHPLPDPGEPVPALALPTVAIFFAALAAWGAAAWAALGDHGPAWATIPVAAAASFAMFTVAHDATHYSISRTRWANGLFGRLSMVFVSAAAAFPLLGYIHIEHHRHSNDDDSDPDTWSSHAPAWQLPLRWATQDIAYAVYYAKRLRKRPKGEVAEVLAVAVTALALVVASIAGGWFWQLALVYLIPERIALLILAWWFDWLPHHGLEATQRSDRYRATRNRVGLEWLYTPLMLSQNYHLVHHLHPSIPFYRYLRTWERNEEAYLERNPAITTVFGADLNAEEYRLFKQADMRGRLRPVRVPEGSSAPHAIFHQVPVSELRPLTDDSVLIGFDVPAELRDAFRFNAGQHLTVRTDLGGEGVRRNYSICAPATADELKIAVKQIPGGAFSTFAMDTLRAGDVLELMTPTGQFGPELDPLQRKRYVAIAVGSGITPVLSVLATTLEIESESYFTLIYGNRTKDSTMFRAELDELESRFADRLEIVHVLSREPQLEPLRSGRIDREKLTTLLATTLSPEAIDEWFVCGPLGLVETTRGTLIEAGVDPGQVHLELFHGYKDESAVRSDTAPCSVSAVLGGEELSFELEGGDSILEGALQLRDDAPYACMGGACGTCRARLIEGSVEMDNNFALKQDDLDAGYVLTCQSHPTSATVRVDYDA